MLMLSRISKAHFVQTVGLPSSCIRSNCESHIEQTLGLTGCCVGSFITESISSCNPLCPSEIGYVEPSECFRNLISRLPVLSATRQGSICLFASLSYANIQRRTAILYQSVFHNDNTNPSLRISDLFRNIGVLKSRLIQNPFTFFKFGLEESVLDLPTVFHYIFNVFAFE